MKNTIFSVLFVMVATLFLISCSGGTGNIQGEIKLNLIEHIEGKDLGGTTVKIKGRNETAATDKDGKFTLKNVDAGTYTLTISRDDWDTKEAEVKVEGGNIAELNETLDYSFGIVKGYIEFPDYKGEEATVIITSEAEGKEEITVQATDTFSFTKLNAGNYKVTVGYGSVSAFFKKTVVKNTLYEEHMTDIGWYNDSDDDGLMDNEDFNFNTWEKIYTEKLNTLIKSPEVEIVLPASVQSADVTLTTGTLLINGEVAEAPHVVANGDKIAVGIMTAGDYDIERALNISLIYGEHEVVGSFIVETISYILLNDDVAVDIKTNLTWQRGNSEELNWDAAVKYCDDLLLGNYDDWRLPSDKELETLVDYKRTNPAINQGAFDCGEGWAETIFSSLESVENNDNAWVIEFDTGQVVPKTKSDFYVVKCVRGKVWDPVNKFVESEPSEEMFITDSSTGLIWTKFFNSFIGCKYAKEWCDELDYAGYVDWRIPTINEIKTIINRKRSTPSSDLPGMVELYFCSSSDSDYYSWGVDFEDGSIHANYIIGSYSAICVR